jgi:catechol 2,3-dioxygenase-like lactoylglutathione lyase family enzyme
MWLNYFVQEFEPKALRVKDGSADLCFLTDDDVKQVRKNLISAGVDMVDLGSEKSDEGTVMRTGARGKLRSVYCRDPDGNLIEWVSISQVMFMGSFYWLGSRISNYVWK